MPGGSGGGQRASDFIQDQRTVTQPLKQFSNLLFGGGDISQDQSFLSSIFQESQRGIEPIPGGADRFAPFPAETEFGLTSLFDRGVAGDPSVNAGRGFLTNLLGTNAFDNPIVNATVNRAQGDIVDQFNLQTAPALAARSRFSGSADNTGLQEVGAFNRFSTERALGDVRATATNQFLGQQLQGANLAPAFGQSSLQDIQAILGAGGQRQGQQQSILDADLARFLDERGIPTQQLGTFGNLLNQAGLQRFGIQTGDTSGFGRFPGSGGGTNSTLGSIAGAAGTAGSLLQVLGPLVFAASSRAFKVDIHDAEPVLDKLSRLEIKRWKYKPKMHLGDDWHIGPMAEDFREVFGVGDGVTLNMVDVAGVALSALKEIGQKLERI